MRARSANSERQSAPHFSWFTDLHRDIPYAFRALSRTPGFTWLCILTIAVGIGANAAIFSVINAVLLRPLPYAQPNGLVRVWEQLKDIPDWTGSVSVPNLLDWKKQSRTIEDFVAYRYTDRIVAGSGNPERILGLEASASLFKTMGARALVGRTFVGNEDQPGQNHVVVLAETFWRRRYGSDSSVVGKTIVLSGESYVVVGVVPSTFAFPVTYVNNDVFLPYFADPANTRGNHFLSVVARLKPGVSLQTASQDMRDVALSIEKENPAAQANRTVLLKPLQESMVGSVRTPLYVLFGAVVLVLFIACANVANLLLARAASRQRDVAVRLALGARRGQLVRQYLTESLILAIAGALLGTAAAVATLKPLSKLAANVLPVGGSIRLDWTVFAFLLAVAVVCGVTFGLMPALQTSATRLRDGLIGAGGKVTPSGVQSRARGLLVVAQVALSLMLLIGASLMMRAFVALRSTDSGMNTEKLVTLRLSVPAAIPDSVVATQLYAPVVAQVKATAGVRDAAMISMLPIDNWGTNGDFWVNGKPKPEPGKAPITELRQITPGYFRTMGIPLKLGRDFTDADGTSAENPIIVNEAMARQYFKDVNPIGSVIRRGDNDASRFTIIGVAGDVKSGGLERMTTPETYFPYTNVHQQYSSLILVVRTATDVAGMITPLRAAIKQAAPDAPVYAVRSMEEIVGRSLASRRLNLTLLAIFAGIALVLASSGLYGVISYLVAQRTREIGIRMALGANRRRVVRMVLRQGLQLAVGGVAVGLVGAFLMTRVLASMLYGVSTRDPVTFTVVPLLLCGVAVLATLLPARRASRVDPMLAIRSE